MPEKMKIKIDDGTIFYTNEIPDDVKELEIDCKISCLFCFMHILLS